MVSQEKQYKLIQNSIEYIVSHYETQPNLETLASLSGLSPSHFQKLFLSYVGVSPKQFLASVTITHAKRILKESPILNTSFDLGLSSAGRLHDLFLKCEGMTPGAYKSGGKGLSLYYEMLQTIFGEMLIVSSEVGVQSLQFVSSPEGKLNLLESLKDEFPNADWNECDGDRDIHETVKEYLYHFIPPNKPIRLSPLGTPFQLKVWQSLLQIPMGEVRNYADVSKTIGAPNANRAVGSAIGKNPIAFLIPCHRVIQSSGLFGGYRWDPKRKEILLVWEKAKTNTV
ncbi:methylated-DNA--[protein]-cysteine S-methyltransferase [Leptospira jelokensis]|uniref:methylated-DNA--[protein]-cysteine S-methyltransferase n=1 Tax=Leptospira jelokensis TaxID=2484931 RepID=UPI0010912509|nr:bifunctional helix-turn-helix domain-containing protein/methylated-DNA--[protein]-cysteine S-methyltransferase [Leptospira jelokensis]TGM06653.1 methylated-DNA--[protein]-cysteine S-methyltransferase [Leptospira jelokensis]